MDTSRIDQPKTVAVAFGRQGAAPPRMRPRRRKTMALRALLAFRDGWEYVCKAVGLLGLLFLFACGGDTKPDALTFEARRVEKIVRAKWFEEVELPDGLEPLPGLADNRDYCQNLHRVEAVVKAGAAFKGACFTDKAWGCQVWEYSNDHLLFDTLHPVVVINATLPVELRPNLMVHEILHAYSLCKQNARGGLSGVDYYHADVRVWDPAPFSVEARAQDAL
jgi:hypothetical protein